MNEQTTQPKISEATSTHEFQKLEQSQIVMDALIKAYGEEVAFSADFNNAIRAAIATVEQAATGKENIARLVTALGGETVATADANQDGQVSVDEARQRVADIFRSLGMDEQAELFLSSRKTQ